MIEIRWSIIYEKIVITGKYSYCQFNFMLMKWRFSDKCLLLIYFFIFSYHHCKQNSKQIVYMLIMCGHKSYKLTKWHDICCILIISFFKKIYPHYIPLHWHYNTWIARRYSSFIYRFIICHKTRTNYMNIVKAFFSVWYISIIANL